MLGGGVVKGHNRVPLTRLVPQRPPFLGMTSSAAPPAPPNSWTAMPMSVPSSAPTAVMNCDPMAARFEKPDCTSRAKSPTSCGISWKKTATVVVAPMVGDA